MLSMLKILRVKNYAYLENFNLVDLLSRKIKDHNKAILFLLPISLATNFTHNPIELDPYKLNICLIWVGFLKATKIELEKHHLLMLWHLMIYQTILLTKIIHLFYIHPPLMLSSERVNKT